MAPNLDVESGDETIHLTVSAGVPYRSYNDLTDLPKINNVQVKGDLSLADLGIGSNVYIADVNCSSDTYSLAGSFNDLKAAYDSGKICIMRCSDKNEYAFIYKVSPLIENYFGQRISVATITPAKMTVKTYLIAQNSISVQTYSYSLTSAENQIA